MGICELCGSANVETDSACRVCGQDLTHAETTTNPTSATATDRITVDTNSAQQDSVSTVRQAQLGMSAYGQSAPTGAPPMFGENSSSDSAESETGDRSEIPSFMQPGHRTPLIETESVQLVSASDLPDWIKQIAEEDAAREQATVDVQEAATVNEAPTSLQKRHLPGETLVAGAATNWLSKPQGSLETSEHWGSAEVASANWGTVTAPALDQSDVVYPTTIPATSFVPTIRELPKPGRKSKQSQPGSSGSTSADTPVYRKLSVQLAFLAAVISILAAVFLN